MMTADEMKLHSARYCFNRMTVHRYAIEVLNGLPIEAAHEKHREAMENYDSIINLAPKGHTFEANDRYMGLAEQAIDIEVEKFRKRTAA